MDSTATVENEKAKAFDPCWGNFKVNRVPDFLRKRILKKIGCGQSTSAGWSVLQNAVRLWGRSWLDHCGSVDFRDRPAFCSQPYGLTSYSVRELVRFCSELDLEFHIDAASTWNPGETVSILIFERQAGDL